MKRLLTLLSLIHGLGFSHYSLAQITLGVHCELNVQTCWVPPKHNEPLFGEYKAINGVFNKDHIWKNPVAFVPPHKKGKLYAYGYGYYLYPPEPGVVVRRDVTPTDKASGIIDFIHLADLGRSLRGGDTFGWRMRVVAQSSARFEVSDVIQTPLKAKIYTRPAGPSSSWHIHLPQEHNPCKSCSGGADNTYYNAQLLNTKDRGQVQAFLSHDSTPTDFDNVFSTGNFWTLNKDDPSGTYVSEVWAYSKLVMRIYFPVEMRP